MPKSFGMGDAVERAIVARVQRGDVRVPAWPRSTHRLEAVLASAKASTADVVKVLRTDDVLAATTLRLANSAFYARGEPVTTLASAVARLGVTELHRLGSASAASRAFSKPGPLSALRRRAWRQAIVEAVVCEKLAELDGDATEASFLGGLMHDIGRVLAIAALEAVGQAPDDAESWNIVDRLHVELGMVLAARWKLPDEIEVLIADHHARDAGPSEPVLRRVQIADVVSRMMEESISVSAERLGSIAELSSRECTALAHALPRMPELIEAYSIEPDAQGPTFSAPLMPAPSSRLIELCAGPTPLQVELRQGDRDGLTVRAAGPGKVNWLLQVKAEDVTFWANVKASTPCETGGYEWRLQPFAMTPEVARRWTAFAGELSHAA